MEQDYKIGETVINDRCGGLVRIVDIQDRTYVCQDVTGYQYWLDIVEIKKRLED